MIIENDERFEKYIKPFLAEDGEKPKSEDEEGDESFRYAIEIKKIVVNGKVKARSWLFFSKVRLRILVVTSLRLFILEERNKSLFRRAPVILFEYEMPKQRLAGISMEYGEWRPRLIIESKDDDSKKGDRWVLRAATKEGASGAYKIIKKMQNAVAQKDRKKKSELRKLQNHALVRYSSAMTKMAESASEKNESQKQAKAGEPSGNE